jgi:hypothetical protein
MLFNFIEKYQQVQAILRIRGIKLHFLEGGLLKRFWISVTSIAIINANLGGIL